MLITPEEAWSKIRTAVSPLYTQPCPLFVAPTHVTAQDVCADRDIPAADRSAMDGYAVRSQDLTNVPAVLRLCGEVAAGSAANPDVVSGTCALISTGANVPAGADAVVMKEDVQVDGAQVRVLKSVGPGQNVFKQGENARKGDVLVPAGVRLDPGKIGACAAVGMEVVTIHRRPQVGILCTGSELLDVASEAGAHQLRNSNGPMLKGALEAEHMAVTAVESVGDDEAATVAALKKALDKADVVVTTGGISVGPHDHVKPAILKLGGEILFHGIAMKPGKPQLFARVGDSWVFSLPGNPLSAMIGLHEFVLPALRLMNGLPAEKCRVARMLPLAGDAAMKGDVYRYLLGELLWTAEGPVVKPIRHVGSSDLVAGAKANGMFILPPGLAAAHAGDRVEFRAWQLS